MPSGASRSVLGPVLQAAITGGLGDERLPENYPHAYNFPVTPTNFQRTLRAFQNRSPFHSFTVELVSGSRIKVDHPEAMIIRGGVGVYVSAKGVPTLFDHQSVSQVTDGKGNGRAQG